MSLSIQDIESIAQLARLQISTADIPEYTKTLSRVFELVAAMDSVDVSAIEPMSHPFSVSQELRDDKITETNQRELFQRIAPSVEAGLYLVPQVIDEG